MFKKFFKKKPKKNIFETGEFNMKNIDVLEEHVFLTSLVYINDIVNIVYPACASCYGISKDKNKTYEEKLNYIGRRVKTSHTSILEHSNVILQVFIPLKETKNLTKSVIKSNCNIRLDLCDFSTSNQDIISMISEVRDVCRYLNIHTDTIKDEDGNPIMRMTIGGSIRGFRYIFEQIRNRQNRLFISIFNVLKLAVPKEFFIDFINDGVMEEYTTIETNILNKNIKTSLVNERKTEDIDIINADDLSHISTLLGISREKCLDFITIAVDFKNMSRVITQQVTRHRNAITQESQRYVNYSDSCFNSPSKFKDKYDEYTVYHTSLGDYNLQELGNTLANVYNDLVKQGVEKEDARGYLPQNIQCGKLFMTFTLRTLFVFLALRTDPHAQAEVRSYAERLADLTNEYSNSLAMGYLDMKELANKYTQPAYNLYTTEYNEIDEEV